MPKREKHKIVAIGRGKKYLRIKRFVILIPAKNACDIWWHPFGMVPTRISYNVVKVRVRKKIWYLVQMSIYKQKSRRGDWFLRIEGVWQIETSFRYGKSELAMESPRLWSFENSL